MITYLPFILHLLLCWLWPSLSKNAERNCMLLVLFMLPFFSNALIVSCGCAQVFIVQGLIMFGFLIKISYRCLRVSPMFPYYGCLIRLCITYFISVVNIFICFHLYRPCLNGKINGFKNFNHKVFIYFYFNCCMITICAP